jgi:hypothetical protein
MVPDQTVTTRGTLMLRGYQWAELLGILFLLASTATQIFYVEPLKREIEWRLAAFSIQQVGQIQADATLTNRVALLTAMNADSAAIGEAEAARAKLKERFETADANVANYVIDKEWIENALQVTVMVLFALGSLLAGFGRAMEMVAAKRE